MENILRKLIGASLFGIGGAILGGVAWFALAVAWYILIFIAALLFGFEGTAMVAVWLLKAFIVSGGVCGVIIFFLLETDCDGGC